MSASGLIFWGKNSISTPNRRRSSGGGLLVIAVIIAFCRRPAAFMSCPCLLTAACFPRRNTAPEDSRKSLVTQSDDTPRSHSASRASPAMVYRTPQIVDSVAASSAASGRVTGTALGGNNVDVDAAVCVLARLVISRVDWLYLVVAQRRSCQEVA